MSVIAPLIWSMPALCSWEACNAFDQFVDGAVAADDSFQVLGDLGADFDSSTTFADGVFDALGGFPGGLGGTAGKAADLVGNHGESLAGLSGARAASTAALRASRFV